MIYNPLRAVNYCITGVDPECIQQNGIDIRVDKIWRIGPNSIADITTKCHSDRTLMQACEETYVLMPGVYEFVSSAYVSLPSNMCGMIIQRSTCNRNGVLVQSGLYDSGFHGHVGGVIYVLGGPVRISRNERICQFILMDADNNGLYSGMYNHDEGEQ